MGPIGKTDVVYTSTKVATGGYQATVKLACMEDAEFAGDVMPQAKDAEKSAAQQALDHYADVIATLPASEKNKNKRKTPGADGAEGAAAAAAPHSAAHTGAKAELNVMCSKILKRTMAKSDILYTTNPVAGQGYQATVTMPALPGEWATHVFAGEPSPKKPDAEQSAASMAVAAMKEDSSLMTLLSVENSKQKSAQKFHKGKDGKKGGGKGGFKGGFDGGGFGGGGFGGGGFGGMGGMGGMGFGGMGGMGGMGFGG